MVYKIFKKYLFDNGYYVDDKIIENILLSFKTKPFIIFTGHSGSGKTKLAQLFANFYLNYIDYFYMIKVSTLKRSYTGGKSDKRVGWGIRKEYLENAVPIDIFNKKYDVEIGGHKTKADLSLVIQLYYDYDNTDLKNYFKLLYEKEVLIKKEDKENGRKHEQQMVDLGVSASSLKNFISDDYTREDEIIIYPSVTEDTLKCKDKILPVEIFNFMPFNKKIPCDIVANGLYSKANFNLKVRMRNFNTPEIKQYLEKLYKNNEENFELKIKGFDHNFDEFISFKSDLFDKINNYNILPVGTDWNDNSHIFGYYNVLTDKYQYTSTLNLIKKANFDPKNPYFLILDEMNSSQVENYLGDILSAMESGEEIPLYGNDDSVILPKNLFIFGTVNVDEKNFKVLPKILDRGNVIELNTVFADEYMEFDFCESTFGDNLEYLQSLLLDEDNFKSNIMELKMVLKNIASVEGNLWEILSNELTYFQKILKNSDFEFSYRVVNEILKYMVIAWRYDGSPKEWDNWKRYFDSQIKQRILPKINGNKFELCEVLNELFNACLNDGGDNDENIENFIVNENNCKYYGSALKLQNMFNVLIDRKCVSFINQF